MLILPAGGFLHYFTEDWNDSNRFAGTGWANTEFRSYTFSTSDDREAHLIELPESRARRQGDEKPLDKEEHINLERTVSQQHKERAQQASQIQAKV